MKERMCLSLKQEYVKSIRQIAKSENLTLSGTVEKILLGEIRRLTPKQIQNRKYYQKYKKEFEKREKERLRYLEVS